MAQAKKVADISEWAQIVAERRTKHSQLKNKVGSIVGKSFATMSAVEKDALLEAIALKLGLIEE